LKLLNIIHPSTCGGATKIGALETILVREKPVLLYMEVFILIIDLQKVFGVPGYLKPH
jgi:ABC-type thiamine transport system ATPase subunit